MSPIDPLILSQARSTFSFLVLRPVGSFDLALAPPRRPRHPRSPPPLDSVALRAPHRRGFLASDQSALAPDRSHCSAGQWIFLLLFSLLSVMAPFSCYFAGLQYLE